MYQFKLEVSISVRLSPLFSHGWRSHIGVSIIRKGCIPGIPFARRGYTVLTWHPSDQKCFGCKQLFRFLNTCLYIMRYCRNSTKVLMQNSLMRTTEVVDDVFNNHRHETVSQDRVLCYHARIKKILILGHVWFQSSLSCSSSSYRNWGTCFLLNIYLNFILSSHLLAQLLKSSVPVLNRNTFSLLLWRNLLFL